LLHALSKVVIENVDIVSYEKKRSNRSDYKVDSNTVSREPKGKCAVHSCTSKGAPLEKEGDCARMRFLFVRIWWRWLYEVCGL
jgi:hypothetical protein